jgi:2-oxoisovalerate dehydrogenase E2 component (dihydrolipoyl transacylase)
MSSAPSAVQSPYFRRKCVTTMSQFVLPDLGEGLEEAQLMQWLVQAGEQVQLNQPLCQVETAKAVVEIPSPSAGVVETLHGTPGEMIPVGAPLVTFVERGAPSAPSPTPGQAMSGQNAVAWSRDEVAAEHSGAVLVGYGTAGSPTTFARRRRSHGQHAPGAAAAPQPTPPTPSAAAARAAPTPPAPDRPAPTDDDVCATPLVRKIARERGIDLRTITGSGPGGRIRAEDLEAAPASTGTPLEPAAVSAPAQAPTGAPTPTPAAAPDEERISTVGLRKAIAAKMVRAATTIPHFTEYGLFNATALVALRERLRSDPAFAQRRLTFLPFFVRALVAAVRAYPIMNSRWDEEGNAIVLKRSIHVGIATDTERGLLVPVIRNAHTLGLADIAAEAEWLIQGARMGKLEAPSMMGGTITITNVGAAGPVETGAPLINPPEVCIVGFGAIKPRPTVVGNDLVVRPGAWISLSCDHRVVDGATATRFLGELVRHLEEPEGRVSGQL